MRNLAANSDWRKGLRKYDAEGAVFKPRTFQSAIGRTMAWRLLSLFVCEHTRTNPFVTPGFDCGLTETRHSMTSGSRMFLLGYVEVTPSGESAH